MAPRTFSIYLPTYSKPYLSLTHTPILAQVSSFFCSIFQMSSLALSLSLTHFSDVFLRLDSIWTNSFLSAFDFESDILSLQKIPTWSIPWNIHFSCKFRPLRDCFNFDWRKNVQVTNWPVWCTSLLLLLLQSLLNRFGCKKLNWCERILITTVTPSRKKCQCHPKT